jgi:hypothetical protein
MAGHIKHRRSANMRHMRLATYEITGGTFQDIAASAKSGMLPKFREQPGFLRYGVADTGEKSLVSISLWETREQADAAAPVAAAWIAENIPGKMTLTTNVVGDLAFYQGIGTPAPVSS